jgi:hypothetical protein
MFYDANAILFQLRAQIEAARENSSEEDFTNFLDVLYKGLSEIWKEVHGDLQAGIAKRCLKK